MPSLTLELPHWIYWSGLVLFPLAAMVIVRWRGARGERGGISLAVAYLLWLFGGFVGLHRFYVKSWLGIVYVPLFLGVLYGNGQAREARNAASNARNAVVRAEFDVSRFTEAVAEGAAGAAERLAEAEQALAAAKGAMVAIAVDLEQWRTVAGSFALVIALLLLIDAVLLPRLVRRRAAVETAAAPPMEPIPSIATPPEPSKDPARAVRTRLTDVIDSISGWTGELVCYWSVIAVFVYYYEVIARYVFNSPTNWAHESMFLMFGMQYLIAGAYAFREDAHVRVDVLYLHLPLRAKVVTDIVTSIFFFIFAGTLLATGWIFMRDSIAVREVSFTEWAIQYWPVKSAIFVGALLILLQGLSKLIKDVVLLTRTKG